jgi:hypothetical protein
MGRIGWDRLVELIFTFAIMAATVTMACIANRQWTALLESNDINRKAYNAAYRSFVVSKGLSSSFIYDSTAQENQWRIYPAWENTGSSPTRDLQIFFNWCPRITDLPKDFTFPDLASTGGFAYTDLAPHETKLGLYYPMPTQLITVLQSHAAKFYFYGWATYHDILDDKTLHQTKFCRVVNDFKGSAGDPNSTFNIEQCGGGHDCEDHECDRQPATIQKDQEQCGGLKIVTLDKPIWSVDSAPPIPPKRPR